eukprot:3486597-Prorocentrum_lima.AAC.1
MTSSLVGSEMCIRDSCLFHCCTAARNPVQWMEDRGDDGFLTAAAKLREDRDLEEAKALRKRLKDEMRRSDTPLDVAELARLELPGAA